MTETYPFKPSRINVANPKNLLPVLRALVAPIFPDPTLRISFLRKIFVRTSPKGTEPNIYEYVATYNNSIFTEI